MDFSLALQQLKNKETIRRASWNTTIYLQLRTPNEFSFFKYSQNQKRLPYIEIHTEFGVSPWTPSQNDLFAEDYEIYSE